MNGVPHSTTPSSRSPPDGVGSPASLGPGRFNRAVRVFNRWVYNPVAMTVAGRRQSPYAVVGHIGRRSGRAYASPVVANVAADGFLIALPYGADVDWCRNVLAAGGCTIRRDGVDHIAVAPEIVDGAEVADELPRAFRVVLRLFGLNARKMRYLRLHRRGSTIRTLCRDELATNSVVAFDVGGRRYLVADIDGDVVAFAVAGPAARELPRTSVAEGRVRCPLHGWPIDPHVGRCGAADHCRYDPVPVEVRGGEIRVLSDFVDR